MSLLLRHFHQKPRAKLPESSTNCVPLAFYSPGGAPVGRGATINFHYFIVNASFISVTNEDAKTEREREEEKRIQERLKQRERVESRQRRIEDTEGMKCKTGGGRERRVDCGRRENGKPQRESWSPNIYLLSPLSLSPDSIDLHLLPFRRCTLKDVF